MNIHEGWEPSESDLKEMEAEEHHDEFIEQEHYCSYEIHYALGSCPFGCKRGYDERD